MRNLFLATFLLVSSFIFQNCNDAKAETTNCHTNADARCTGSASCTACSNCTRCAHCSSGGTCGVCAGSSSGRSFYSSSYSSRSSKKKKKSVSSSSNSYNSLGSFSYPKPQTKTKTENYSKTIYSETLSVKKENVNIRELPSLDADVIAVVEKYTILKNLGKTGDWYKVEVPKTGQIGYVYESLVD